MLKKEKLPERLDVGEEQQRGAQGSGARQHDRAGGNPIGQVAHAEAAHPGGDHRDGVRERGFPPGPAEPGDERLQKNGNRGHRADPHPQKQGGRADHQPTKPRFPGFHCFSHRPDYARVLKFPLAKKGGNPL